MVNDFTIRVATVNGSGSQSSNLVLTNAIFRLGIPVAPKNVFPSNIEGLPTWFDVRVTSKGYQCRTRDVDVLVGLNAATWQADVASVKPGGVVIHESTYPVAGETLRTDLTYYAVPFIELSKKHFADKGDLRKYLLNMIYVGSVAFILDIPEETIEAGIRNQFKSKAAAVETNMNAVRVGYEYARENLKKSDAYRLEPMTGLTDGLLFMEGNRAAALGCIMGGCTVAAWYPITPSSSLCENFIALAEKYRVDPDTGEHYAAIIQAEDELAAAGMVFGAGWAGARAMTSTSGPGVSLMAEYVGYAYYAEIPGVIFDVQRAGPSTGLPTRTMQGDVAFAHTLSHGDTKHIVLLPATIEDAYQLSMDAFDLADRFQTPVFVLSDLDLGHELVADEAAALSGEAVRSRESASRGGLEQSAVVGPLSRRRQGRHPLSHGSGNGALECRVFHARNRPRRGSAVFGTARRVAARPRSARSQDGNGGDGRTRTDRGRQPPPDRDPRLRHDASRRRRSARAAARRRYRNRLHARCAPFRFPRTSRSSSHATNASTSSNKIATASSTESCARNCRRT